ncbi:MAG: T9SS type A sorting domain-containing protein [Bacteroidales bacterium]|nr:T9SS type A sorting domain-containing protein [Bacteroidales bacterium]
MKTYTLRLLQFQPHILSFTLLVMLLNLGAIAQSSYIYIYAPFNGQVTYRNSPMDISWYSYGADTVNISYSTNAGASWTEIADNVTGIYYSWTIPNILSDQCLLRLTSASEPTVFGEVFFSIVETPLLTLTTPNGGETWNFGEIANVSWTGTNLPYYLYIDYSIDGGINWMNLGSGYSEPGGGSAQVYVPFLSSSEVLVKIYDPYYPEVTFDISDQYFTIFTPPVIMNSPNDGDAFYIGEESYFSWIANDISLVNIDLSTDGGASWQSMATDIDAANGYYYWTVQGTPSANCLIRVSDASDPTKFGLSGTFTLLATPVITLSSPQGGEIFNTNQPVTINWTYDNPNSFYLFLEYSSDNGQNWNYIDFPVNAGLTGSYQWTTPMIESDQYKIRISDYYLPFVTQSSNAFSVLNFPETPICMVTVDSASNRNVIVWEKPVSPLINQFVVYKETDVADVYNPIGTLNYSDFSTFTDTSSNPAVKSYRYKLGFTDGAGHTFPAGDLHQTIHLSINQGVGSTWNLIWTDYLGFNVGSYAIYRGTSPGQMSLITSISSSFNSYTDLDAPAGTIYYMVEVVNPNGCTPFKASNFSSSRSNIATNKSVGIGSIPAELKATVYPNPATDKVFVKISGIRTENAITVQLSNMLGKVVYHKELQNNEVNETIQVPVSQLQEGIYMLSVTSGDQKLARKVVVNH